MIPNFRTRPFSWYSPKLIVSSLGVSIQWWWRWRGGGLPLHWFTIWFRPLRVTKR